MTRLTCHHNPFNKDAKRLFPHLLFFIWTVLSASAQGTLIYDQVSDAEPPVYGASVNAYNVIAQSFTPTLSSVGFVNLAYTADENQSGGMAYVDLWSGSVGGTLLGSSMPVSIPAGWAQFGGVGVTNFFFSTPIAVEPGTTYYLQPVMNPTTGTSMYLLEGVYYYPGGELYDNGVPVPNGDLWFQEGTYVVPEPSCHLIFLGGCFLLSFWICRKRNLSRRCLHLTAL